MSNQVPPVTAVSNTRGHPNRSTRGPILGGLTLTVLGLVALAGQGLGLQSLVTFSGQQAVWEASQTERSSIAEEHAKLLVERLAELEKTHKAVQDAKAELDAARPERDRVTAELTRIKRELELVRQARDEAVNQQQAANQQMQKSVDASQIAESKTSEMLTQQTAIRVDLVKITLDHDQLKKAGVETDASLQQRMNQLSDLQKQQDDFQKRIAESATRLRDMQQGLVKALSELETTSGDRDKALRQRDEAVVIRDAYLKEVTRLKDSTQTLNDENTRLTDVIARLKQEKADAETSTNDVLKTSKDLDAQISAKRGELSALTTQGEQLARSVRTQDLDAKEAVATTKPLIDQLQQVKADLSAQQQAFAAVSKRLEDARAEEQRLLTMLQASAARAVAAATTNLVTPTTAPTNGENR